MSEKRFYNDGKYVMQNGEVYVACDGEHNADVVATALNELLEENEQLKQQLKKDNDVSDNTKQKLRDREKAWGELFKDYIDVLKQKDGLEKENEQLKKENKHLQCTIESNSQDDYIDYLEKQNERLKERITELASNDKIVFMNGQDYEIF